MDSVMERRNLLAGLAVAVISLFVLTGTAFASRPTHHRAKTVTRPATEPPAEEAACAVRTEPKSFMDQGEFGSASSIADIVEVECDERYSEKYVQISATELYNRCNKHLWWSGTDGWDPNTGPSTTAELDNDGNATVVLIGGPSCAAGESLVSAHLEVAPYTTATAGFTVVPPAPTKVGVTVYPNAENPNGGAVESEFTSSVAGIAQVEFPPVFAEEPVNLNASQLYSRCHYPPGLEWVTMGPNGEPYIAEYGEELVGEGGGEGPGGFYLDNDGNAFAVMIAASSCASGSSLIEASLEHAPYTTKTAEFTILPPQPTPHSSPEAG